MESAPLNAESVPQPEPAPEPEPALDTPMGVSSAASMDPLVIAALRHWAAGGVLELERETPPRPDAAGGPHTGGASADAIEVVVGGAAGSVADAAAPSAGLDEGLLAFSLPILVYIDTPHRCNE